MTQSKEIFKMFNTTYIDFLNYIKSNTSDPKYASFYRKNMMVRETNIKLIIQICNNRMTIPYYEMIMERDVDFFMENNYSEVKGDALNYIVYFKHLYQQTKPEYRSKFVDYVRKLTELCHQYHN